MYYLCMLSKRCTCLSSRLKCSKGVNKRVKLACTYSSTSEAEPLRRTRYSDTVMLPKTTYPRWLSNNKRLQLEVDLQNSPDFSELYSWQMQQKERPLFVLHDGPPYANGLPHMGHAINKILKDIINRYKLLCGYRVHYVPGWDCHGLPIELKAITSEDEGLSPLEVRRKARQVAESAIRSQKATFKRWGVMGDWENSYLTLDKQYVTTQLQTFWTLYQKGLLFRDLKPVYWSPASGSALAEAELEYNHDHKSLAAYVRFPLSVIPPSLNSSIPSDKNVYALIWTTTPWTLPANKIICYSDALQYSLVKETTKHDYYIIAAELLQALECQLSIEFEHVATFPGKVLQDAKYTTLLSNTEASFVAASHVTALKGTGLVHTCPEFGFDDFSVGAKHGIKLVDMVDDKGCYTHEAGDVLKNKSVLEDGNEAVLRLFSDHILCQKDYVHSYPYDWRFKKPVIIRPSKQWFINTDVLKNRALECLKNIEIIPSVYAKNMEWMLHSRPYWCISRQRVWGTPIPAFYEKSSGKPVITKKLVDHWCKLTNINGSDFWWNLTNEELVPEVMLENESINIKELVKGNDILDIWFDSGISWKCVLKDANYKADMCVEGLDQARGWFQASLLTGVALQNQAPYKKLLFHGFAVDNEYRKMSKSLGNVIDPKEIVEGVSEHAKSTALGADGLRWWVASHSSTTDSNIPVKTLALQQTIEDLRKLRNTFCFLLGALSDFDPNKELIATSKLQLINHYVLHRLSQVQHQVLESYSQFKFEEITKSLIKFMYNEISSMLIHMNKDKLYCGEKSSTERKSIQTVCYYLMRHLLYALAPIVPHFVEDVCQHTSFFKRSSIFKNQWPSCPEEWTDKNVEKAMNVILSIKSQVDKRMKESDMNCPEFDLTITGSEDLLSELRVAQVDDRSFYSDLCYIWQTASVSLTQTRQDAEIVQELVVIEGNVEVTGEKFTATLNPACRSYCDRCRRHVSEKKDHLCTRCSYVMDLP